MPHYVGMAGKQNGGYHGSISVQTPIFHLVVNSTRLKTLRSAVWRCPKLYIIVSAARSLTCRDDLDSKWRLLLAENELSRVSLLSRISIRN